MPNGDKKKKNTCKYTESEILDNFSGYVYTRGYFSGFINVSRFICINMKKVEEGTNDVKNCGFFPACNAVVMLNIEARPGCTGTKGCGSARETNKNKKSHF